MRLPQLLSSIACLAMLAACATPGSERSASEPVASVTATMAEADALVSAGHPEKAIVALEKAAASFPTDKAPWLRIAQLHFDSSKYGAAIVHALEAIERDPDDLLAHSIVAVSGLRVSSRALADLTEKNDLTGSVRSEAQELAKLLRSALGEEVLVPAPVKQNIRTRAVVRNAAPPAPRARAKPSSSANPFESLLGQ